MFIELTNGSNDNQNEKILFSIEGMAIKERKTGGCEISYVNNPGDICWVQENYDEIKGVLEYSETLKDQGYTIVSRESIERIGGELG